MYKKRIFAFVTIFSVMLLICILRLAQLQLLSSSEVQKQLAKIKSSSGLSKQLTSSRGKILDRNGIAIAEDVVGFELQMNYSLISVMDKRIVKAKLLEAKAKHDENKINNQLQNQLEQLNAAIDKCSQMSGTPKEQLLEIIKSINDKVWNIRSFMAWRKNLPDSKLLNAYKTIESIPLEAAISEFEQTVQDENERLLLVIKSASIAEMKKNWSIIDLDTDEKVFAAQIEFMEYDGISISPKTKRFYPFGSAAAQTIGWVSTATKEEYKELFGDDELQSYLASDICGRQPGIEYICEGLLRGKRGKAVYDADSSLISSVETQPGQDIQLTIDIELQKKIEEYIINSKLLPDSKNGIAAAVIDVSNGDIIAMVSLPNYDLNRIRYDYSQIVQTPGRPVINRVIDEYYPPGSVIKPIILVAGMESGVIKAEDTISCPAKNSPQSWPNCWIFNDQHVGHDSQWINNARNAIKGSCNIYFSHLGNRIEAGTLQQWLYNFGYGKNILDTNSKIKNTPLERNFEQTAGIISNTIPEKPLTDFSQTPALTDDEKRWFGIGQGNLRTTPLQVANAMAALARGGIYKNPKLFVSDPNEIEDSQAMNLNISAKTMQTVLDGMNAVVNEPHGTAYNEMSQGNFAARGVKVYGKTGSTERPYHAWFAGFAKDRKNRCIAMSVIVEGGQHGSTDAAPIAREIINYCIEQGCIGH